MNDKYLYAKLLLEDHPCCGETVIVKYNSIINNYNYVYCRGQKNPFCFGSCKKEDLFFFDDNEEQL
jgi:hypothetical protein